MPQLTQGQQTELDERMDHYFKSCQYCKHTKSSRLPQRREKGVLYEVRSCDCCHAEWNYREEYRQEKKEEYIKELTTQ